MHLRSVLENDHVLALCPRISEFRDRQTGVRKQPLLVARIDPGTRHDSRAIARSNLVFISVDDGVEGGGIDESFLHEQRFERLRTQRRLGGNDLVIVLVMLSVETSWNCLVAPFS